MKKKVQDRRELIGKHDYYSPAEMLAMIGEAFDSIPIDDRHSCRFTVDTETYAYDDGEYPKFYVVWDRDETDEEEKKREDQEAVWKAQREAGERAQYEALKKKFGGQ